MAKAKGSVLIGAVKFLRKHREQAAAVLPEFMHPYLEQTISPALWYPEEDWLALIRAIVEILPGGQQEILEKLGEVAAREHLEGLYEHLMLDPDPLILPKRCFAIWGTQHDTGECVVTIKGPEAVEVAIIGYACPTEEVCQIAAGYFREAFRLGGMANCQGRKLQCRVNGADSCRWAFSWSPTGAS